MTDDRKTAGSSVPFTSGHRNSQENLVKVLNVSPLRYLGVCLKLHWQQQQIKGRSWRWQTVSHLSAYEYFCGGSHMQTILLGATLSAMFFNKYINKQIINSQNNNIKESEVLKKTSDAPRQNTSPWVLVKHGNTHEWWIASLCLQWPHFAYKNNQKWPKILKKYKTKVFLQFFKISSSVFKKA